MSSTGEDHGEGTEYVAGTATASPTEETTAPAPAPVGSSYLARSATLNTQSSNGDIEAGTGTGMGDKLKRLKTVVFEGGTVFDGFLLAASQEVGQVILTLPYVFSLVGMGSGITLQFVFATMALYTNFLLVSLHAEFRNRIAKDPDDPRSSDPFYVVSYHDIIGGLLGKGARIFTLIVVFFALVGLSTVQIIATSSNFYILDNSLSKRTWSLIWGGIFGLVAFVPTFRHYRVLSVIGILTTTYTSWFMCIAAAVEGPVDGVVHDAPRNVEEFFRGMVGLLFTFGGHASNIEVADVMNDHATYDKSYFYSYLYVFTLTMPNAISAYRTYGNIARDNSNSFNLYPRSGARDFGIIMMSLHQLVAFGLFIGPLFHMWEKFWKVHDKPFWMRSLYRLPLVGFILLIAVAFPFFGAINSVLGAFTTSLTTYIVPLVAYNLVYKPGTDTSEMAKQLPPWAKLHWVRFFNWTFALLLLVCGVGIGGWASITNFVKQIEKFEYFAECYQCG